MQVVSQELNLARKWRPRHFGQIVGQQISVAMLRNSLFSGALFPVYLFEGQHGCGKTSTARIFATALNCTAPLVDNAQQMPCLECQSCQMMAQGCHPDFIEIDAASHTGVDHVRGLIESSSYMPLVGRRKVFLIDEVHMLSKSAFNALLKVLEEPCASALFMLATTEVHKLPETVVSRCFQLHFTPLEVNEFANYLGQLCQQEQIVIQPDALALLVQHARGAGRDAINMLERVRFVASPITAAVVLDALGKTGVATYLDLMDSVVRQDAVVLLELLAGMERGAKDPAQIWHEMVQLCRVLLWSLHGAPVVEPSYAAHAQRIASLAQQCGKNRVYAMLQIIWSYEQTFLHTTAKQACLELTLLTMCQQVPVADLKDLIDRCQKLEASAASGSQAVIGASRAPLVLPASAATVSIQHQAVASQPTSQPVVSVKSTDAVSVDGNKQAFLDSLQDQMLFSILKQAHFTIDADISLPIIITLHSPSKFFKQQLEDALPMWQPLLAAAYNRDKVTVQITLPQGAVPPSLPSSHSASRPQLVDSAASQPSPQKSYSPTQTSGAASVQQTMRNPSPARASLTLDPAQWPVAHKLLKYFPGTVYKRS